MTFFENLSCRSELSLGFVRESETLQDAAILVRGFDAFDSEKFVPIFWILENLKMPTTSGEIVLHFPRHLGESRRNVLREGVEEILGGFSSEGEIEIAGGSAFQERKFRGAGFEVGNLGFMIKCAR